MPILISNRSPHQRASLLRWKEMKASPKPDHQKNVALFTNMGASVSSGGEAKVFHGRIDYLR